MLTELTIENFAIIERLHVRFDAGFTVLTGETGAGKSIIIDALQAALGARVTSDIVRAGAPHAAVEAVFAPEPSSVADLIHPVLGEYGVEPDDVLILRREMNVAGRGTGRINGRAVPLSALLAVGALLVDIHGQSDHLSILRRDRQLDILDRYGALLPLRDQVAEAVRDYTRARRTLNDLLGGQREAEQRLDLLRFQVQEIDSAQLAVGEDEELAAERNRLANAERLMQLTDGMYQRLTGESGGAIDLLHTASTASQELASIDPDSAGLAERLAATRYELDDVAQEIRTYRDRVEFDPRRLDVIEERIDVYTRLQRKYGPTVEQVIAYGEEARRALNYTESFDERRVDLERELEVAGRRAGERAAQLNVGRRQAADDLNAVMSDALRGLGLSATAFTVELTRTESADGLELPGESTRYAFNSTGIDQATFLVSFNPGEPLRPLDKVASGGETSRFLLALKSVLALADQIPTLVFDEIDVGVGARNGMVVAERLHELAGSHQVLSITHLPQIAALADQHLTVSKTVTNGRTGVELHVLERDERVREIAEMMSGSGSEIARRNAAELLEAAHREG
ncbi:MAG: DNA repair protein RecN [Chloroflexota bacterium]